LDTINIVFIILFLISLIFTINFLITIKVLKKEILRYKKLLHSCEIQKTNFLKQEDFLYQNIKKNINILKKDIKETDFNISTTIKEDIISALEDIDFYDKSDNND